METDFSFQSIPFGSLIELSDEDRSNNVSVFLRLPATIQDVLDDPKTGAYITGLARVFNLSPETTPAIAFLVFQIMVGEKTLTELPVLLATELQVPTDKTQLMAQEIEKELFAPIKAEWEQYLATRQTVPPQEREEPTEQNVLDLTTQPGVPQPPPSIGSTRD